MNRIAVIGCVGSGKSHLARELGRMLRAPVTHLDALYYDEEWNPQPQPTFEALQRGLVSGDRWILDGNYNTTLPIRLKACDTVILMDVPTWAALWGLVSRQLKHGRGQDQASGIYNRIHWGVLLYAATYRRRMRPEVLAKIGQHAGHAEVIFLRGRRRTRKWLEQVAARQP